MRRITNAVYIFFYKKIKIKFRFILRIYLLNASLALFMAYDVIILWQG